MSGAACSSRRLAAPAREPIAKTKAGGVRGELVDGVYRFKGIRYGEDTSKYRFRPPQPARPWPGVVDALEFGNRCPQPPTGRTPFRLFDSWLVPENDSEDCLFLNVWTRGIDDGKQRPVMVWIHGGGFVAGSGNMPSFDGERMAARHDVVFVSITHRLSLFGYSFLAELLGAEYSDSGNAGTLDQILALQWVRDNAAAFGGDPRNVTIFGESGGGAKTWFLLGAPAAQGLFHRAVVQSSSLMKAVEPEGGQATSAGLLQALGLQPGEAKRLLDFSSAELVAAMMKAQPGAFAGVTTYAPVHDGRTIPWQLDDPKAQAVSADLPVILGTTLTETTLLIGGASPAWFDLAWEGLPEKLSTAMRMRWGWPAIDVAQATTLIAQARRLMPDATPSDVFFRVSTEASVRARAFRKAELRVQQRAPVYMFLVEWRTPVDGGKWGSPHALSVPLSIDNVYLSASMVGEGAPEAQALADKMSASWAAFARSGNPDTSALPHWPLYDTASRQTMVFDNTSKVVSDPTGDLRRLVADAARSVF